MARKIVGTVIAVLSLIFLLGAIFVYNNYLTNREEYDERADSGAYLLDQEQKEEDEAIVENQLMMSMSCGILFVICLTVGAALIASDRSKQQPQQTVIFQQPSMSQFQPMPQLKQCHQCGNGIQPGWNLCPNCGAQQK